MASPLYLLLMGGGPYTATGPGPGGAGGDAVGDAVGFADPGGDGSGGFGAVAPLSDSTFAGGW